MCTHSVGREFRKGTEKVACLCFMMSGASVGKIYKARDDSKGGGGNTWALRDPLPIRWLIHPHVNQASWDWWLEHLSVVSPRGFSQHSGYVLRGSRQTECFKRVSTATHPFMAQPEKSESVTSTMLLVDVLRFPLRFKGKGHRFSPLDGRSW